MFLPTQGELACGIHRANLRITSTLQTWMTLKGLLRNLWRVPQQVRKGFAIIDPRSNERNLRKTRKLLQRKGSHFYCSKFDTLRVSCLFTNCFETLFKKFYVFENGQIRTCWRHLSKQFCTGAQNLKVKKLVYVPERNANTFTLSSYYDISLLMFPLHCGWNLRREIKRNLPETFDRGGTRSRHCCIVLKN